MSTVTVMKSPWPYCNARKPGFAESRVKLPVGTWGGKGYCQKTAGHGFGKTHANSERRAMRCKRHIGSAVNGPRGPEHHLFVTGKHSKFVQSLSVPELRAKLMEICDDPELLNMSPLVANLIRRLIALTERAEAGVLSLGRNLHSWETAEKQILANDIGGLTMTVAEGLKHAKEGSSAEAVWQEIYTLTDRVVRTQSAEMDRRIAIGKWIRVEKIQGVREQMADYLKEAVIMFVDDKGIQSKILNHVAKNLLLEADEIERMSA